MPPILSFRAGFAAAALSICVAAPGAQGSDTQNDAILGGNFDLNLRYRFDGVERGGFSRDAKASTLRAALGYGTGSWHGLSAYLGLHRVLSIGKENCNSTVNGRTSYPVIAGPEVFDLWQVYVQWESPWDVTARARAQICVKPPVRAVPAVLIRART